MKRNILFITLSLTTLLLSSCLKDKGFQDGVYGINLDQGAKGVVFAKAPQMNVGVDLTTSSKTYKIVLLQASEANAPSSDIAVTIAEKPSLVTAAGLAALPAGAAVVPTSMTIHAGKYYDTLAITFPNSSTLDLTKTYGLGLTITGASGGYTFTGNKSDLLLIINLKNSYDATYHSTGYFYHPSSPRPLSEDKHLATTGPNSVSVGLGDLGGAGYVAVLTINANNTVTITPDVGAAGTPYTPFPTGLPTTNPGYTAGWTGSAQCNNTYDPATKTFKLRYGYLGGTGWRVTEEILVRQ